MSPDAIFVLVLMLATFLAFVTEAASVDVIGLFVMVALMLGQVLSPNEALGGFANDAVITIAAMFVLSAGLIRGGALDTVTRLLFHLSGGSRTMIIGLVLVSVAVSSAFLNNTPVAVIFLPVVLAVCDSHRTAPSKLLIPMSYASILGGTCTLVGTSTNLLVKESAEAHAAGLSIGMFDFTVPGLIFAAGGFGFLALLGDKLLPNRATVSGSTQDGRIREFVTEVLFPEDSPLIGRSFQEVLAKLGSITPLMLLRGDEVVFAPFIRDPRAQFVRAGDVVLLKGEPGAINALLERDGVTLPPELGEPRAKGKTVTMVELVVNPNSPLIGRTIGGSAFARRHGGAAAIAVLRHDEHLRRRVSDIRLRLGDTLLVVCDEAQIDRLRGSSEFILLEGVERDAKRPDKGPLALAIMALVVVLAALDLAPLPISTLAVTGVLLMVLTGVLPLRLAYASIDMSIIVMIAGMLALGKALEVTELVSYAGDWVVDTLADLGPRAVLAGVYVASAVLTCMVSNNAVAVLLTPLAIEAARGMGFAPEPFVFATLFGASASFATPIGYQTNLFVYAPGGYRFTDYMRIGLPLNLLMFLLALVVIPWYWPLVKI